MSPHKECDIYIVFHILETNVVLNYYHICKKNDTGIHNILYLQGIVPKTCRHATMSNIHTAKQEKVHNHITSSVL